MLSKNPFQTKKIGRDFSKNILRNFKNKTLIIGLKGDLGGGKTTFLQGFAQGLKIKKKILSPTFVIIRKFTIPKNKKNQSYFNHFYHVDCYRIKKPREILSIGFDKIISDPKNIVAIEWVDRIKTILPKDIFFLKFKFVNKKNREITIKFPKK